MAATTTDTPTKPDLLDWLAQHAQTADLSGLDGQEVTWAFRAVRPDLRSRGEFRYPWPGRWAEAPGPIIAANTGPCPNDVGDGLCIAKNFYGASQGGIPLSTLLLVGYTAKDVLGEDQSKVRVRRMYVADLLDVATLLRSADLRSADLGSADLGSADLGSANLRYANLGSANLRYANLRSAEYNQLTLWPPGFDVAASGAMSS